MAVRIIQTFCFFLLYFHILWFKSMHISVGFVYNHFDLHCHENNRCVTATAFAFVVLFCFISSQRHSLSYIFMGALC